MSNNNYHEWTSCETYGHRFYAAETQGLMRCQDCYDEYEDMETWHERMAESEDAHERALDATQNEEV